MDHSPTPRNHVAPTSRFRIVSQANKIWSTAASCHRWCSSKICSISTVLFTDLALNKIALLMEASWINSTEKNLRIIMSHEDTKKNKLLWIIRFPVLFKLKARRNFFIRVTLWVMLIHWMTRLLATIRLTSINKGPPSNSDYSWISYELPKKTRQSNYFENNW